MGKSVEAIWDDVWQTAAAGRTISALREFYSGQLRELIAPHVNASSRVLELGCGTATLLLSLAPRVKEVVGLDISSEGLKIAQGHQRERGVWNATFVKADCQAVPYESEFDVVYSAGLIEHFFKRDLDIVRQHLKAARPGGRAVLSVPYAYTLHGLHYLLTRPKLTRRFWPWSQERYFQKFYSRRALREVGEKTGYPFRVYFLRPWPIGLLLGILVLEISKVDEKSKL